MNAIFLILAVLSMSFEVFAQRPSYSNEEFCADREDRNFVKDLTIDRSNLMPFSNRGGIINGGVCWWHSRFQRNALYLTIYKSRMKKPSEREAVELIKDIRQGRSVVVIPGYRNFRDFAYDNEELIQRELEKWQKSDGITRFAWVKGLRGRPEVEADKLKKIMDEIYEEVEVNHNMAYNKLQIPGIAAHSWLVVRMDKVYGGYNLEIIDSNFASRTQVYRYREGDTSINYHGHFNFTPYLEKTNEMERINKVIARHCRE